MTTLERQLRGIPNLISIDRRTSEPLFTVEPLDTAGCLRKAREYDSRLQSKRRDELTAAQKDQLDSYENQIVSLTGWLVLAYAGPRKCLRV